MIKVAIVNYLNTAPFMRGLRLSGLLQSEQFRIDPYYPAECARALLEGRADIGLVPVAILANLKEYYIVGDTCIGAVEPVRSVLLVSDVPVDQIEKVYLDYQSRTSVALCRVLMQRFWKHQPEFLDAPEDYLNHVTGTTAAVVIGDRAFGESMKHPFVYDLASCWQQFTGLPFVFALWISLKPISPSHEVELNNALNMGISQAEEAAEEVLDQYPDYFEVKNYLTHSISYTLDAAKRKGLETFLQMLSNPDDL